MQGRCSNFLKATMGNQATPPQILEIKMVPAGVELVLAALAKLPYEQSAPLIEEIRGQAQYQIELANAPAPTETPTEGELQ